MFSPGPRHNQCEWFMHNIGPGPCHCPGPGDSQCEYTITRSVTIKSVNYMNLPISNEVICNSLGFNTEVVLKFQRRKLPVKSLSDTIWEILFNIAILIIHHKLCSNGLVGGGL